MIGILLESDWNRKENAGYCLKKVNLVTILKSEI